MLALELFSNRVERLEIDQGFAAARPTRFKYLRRNIDL